VKIFILDNYDSFTYNLVHIIEQFAKSVAVKRNDQVILSDLDSYDKIVFSPGPGLPSEVSIMSKIIDHYKFTKPILGVCLGHQAIAEYFGAHLVNMPEVNHGRELETTIILEDYIFKQVPKTFFSGRYHSWIVDHHNLPNELEVTSLDKENIMSIRHKQFDLRGVQFHPESVMTKFGKKILENWVLK